MRESFPYVAISLAAAYLLVVSVPVFLWSIRRIRDWIGRRNALNRLRGMRAAQKIQVRIMILQGAGVLVGILLGGWTSAFVDATWLLFWLSLIGLVLEEFHEPRRLSALPAALQILDVFCAASRRGQDAYGALLAAAEELLPGDANQIVEQSLDRQLLHQPPEKVFAPLANFHPALREIVQSLRDHGWRANDRFIETANRIYQRTQTELDRTALHRMFYYRSKAWLQSGKSAVLGMIMALFIIQTTREELGRFLVFGVLAVVLVIFLSFFQRSNLVWLRRMLLIGSVAAVMGFVFWDSRTKVASSAAAAVPSATITYLSKPTMTIPTVTSTATVVSSYTPTLQLTTTPRPVVRRGVAPAYRPAKTQIRKNAKLYPSIWMNHIP